MKKRLEIYRDDLTGGERENLFLPANGIIYSCRRTGESLPRLIPGDRPSTVFLINCLWRSPALQRIESGIQTWGFKIQISAAFGADGIPVGSFVGEGSETAFVLGGRRRSTRSPERRRAVGNRGFSVGRGFSYEENRRCARDDVNPSNYTAFRVNEEHFPCLTSAIGFKWDVRSDRLLRYYYAGVNKRAFAKSEFSFFLNHGSNWWHFLNQYFFKRRGF